MKSLDSIMGGWIRKTVIDPLLWLTLAGSSLVAILGDERGLRAVSAAVGSAQIQIGIVFLGIVLAAFSILVAFLDEEYIELLEQSPPGIQADLWPFVYTSGVAVFCAAFGMTLVLIGSPQNTFFFRLIFFFALWSFSYLLCVMFDLVRSLAEYARLRATLIRTRKARDDTRKIE